MRRYGQHGGPLARLSPRPTANDRPILAVSGSGGGAAHRKPSRYAENRATSPYGGASGRRNRHYPTSSASSADYPMYIRARWVRALEAEEGPQAADRRVVPSID